MRASSRSPVDGNAKCTSRHLWQQQTREVQKQHMVFVGKLTVISLGLSACCCQTERWRCQIDKEEDWQDAGKLHREKGRIFYLFLTSWFIGTIIFDRNVTNPWKVDKSGIIYILGSFVLKKITSSGLYFLEDEKKILFWVSGSRDREIVYSYIFFIIIII